jgi:hypothetical protein
MPFSPNRLGIARVVVTNPEAQCAHTEEQVLEDKCPSLENTCLGDFVDSHYLMYFDLHEMLERPYQMVCSGGEVAILILLLFDRVPVSPVLLLAIGQLSHWTDAQIVCRLDVDLLTEPQGFDILCCCIVPTRVRLCRMMTIKCMLSHS